MIQLGDECIDTVTGFRGTAAGIAFYIGGGTAKILLEAPTPTGDAKERWISEGRLEIVEETPSIGFARPPGSAG